MDGHYGEALDNERLMPHQFEVYDSRLTSDPEESPIYLMCDLIDEIMISADDTGSMRPKFFSSHSGGYESICHFEFVETERGDGSWLWPLNEIGISIAYSRDKELNYQKYDLEVARRICQSGIENNSIITRYAIETYGEEAHGTLYATIDELNMESGKGVVSRSMTPYDAEQLADYLFRLYEMQLAVRRERGIIATLSN